MRLRMSALGAEFPRERFLSTPVRLIDKALQEVSDHEQATANINSMSTATLANLVLQVAHGFSGSKRAAPKSKAQDYLPFPNWEPARAKTQQLDAITKAALVTLAKQRRIPVHVFNSLMTPPSAEP